VDSGTCSLPGGSVEDGAGPRRCDKDWPGGHHHWSWTREVRWKWARRGPGARRN